MKNLIAVLAIVTLLPAMVLAAPSKSRTAPKTIRTENTSILSNSASTSSTPSFDGLSVWGAFDTTSSANLSANGGSGTTNIDKTMIIGAQYQFPQFTQGVAAQVGGGYEFARTIANSEGAQLSNLLAYGELVAQLTPAVELMGGLNYGIPSLSNAGNVSISGKVGFQLGAAFKVTNNFAIDGRYRSVEHQLSAGNQTVSLKLQGLMLDARYMF